MLLKKRKRNIGLALLLATLILEGCGLTDSNEGQQIQVKPDQTDSYACLETKPLLEYVVPTVLPGILLNQMGYDVSADKVAFIKGEKLPPEFHIVDSQTENIVYSGYLTKKEYDTAAKEYIGYADFTDFTQEGTFYIECDIIGRSYEFSVQNDIYREQMKECLHFLDKGREGLSKEDIIPVCDCLSNLLLSYELYGSVYDGLTQEETIPSLMEEVKLFVEQLISLQDMSTGVVFDGDTPLYEESAWLAAVLAKFSYSYQKYDSTYANACLQASDKAWKYLEKANTDVKESLLYYGATELYRATGKYMYHESVKRLGADISLNQMDGPQTFGTLTYASTKRKVDVDLCGSLLGVLLNKAEKIAEDAQQDVFGIGCSFQDQSLEEILWDGVIMSSMDYVITNNEYATIIKNYNHYLAGKNELAINCIHLQRTEQSGETDLNQEDTNKIGSDIRNTARYMMILSEIMSHEQEE